VIISFTYSKYNLNSFFSCKMISFHRDAEMYADSQRYTALLGCSNGTTAADNLLTFGTLFTEQSLTPAFSPTDL